MTKIYPGFLPCVVLILMIVSTLCQSLPPLGSILPKIDQENFKLTPQGNGYTLSIQLPEGSSREENVELINAGTPEQYLSVSGYSSVQYPTAIGTATYTANKDGNHVQYNYYKIYFIGVGALKAAAG